MRHSSDKVAELWTELGLPYEAGVEMARRIQETNEKHMCMLLIQRRVNGHSAEECYQFVSGFINGAILSLKKFEEEFKVEVVKLKAEERREG